jgi:hypothetical protein
MKGELELMEVEVELELMELMESIQGELANTLL